MGRPLELVMVREEYGNPWLPIVLLVTMLLYVGEEFLIHVKDLLKFLAGPNQFFRLY
jgi:hypothetical protein